MDTASDRICARSLPRLLDAVPLKLGEDEQDAQKCLAHRCRQVDVVGDAYKHGTVALEFLERVQRADERACEAIELGEDQPIALTRADALHDLVENGSAHCSAADIQLGGVPCERMTVSLCPWLDPL